MLKPEEEIRTLAGRIQRSLERAKVHGVCSGLEAMAGVKLALEWVLCDPQSDSFMDVCKAGLALEESFLNRTTPPPSSN